MGSFLKVTVSFQELATPFMLLTLGTENPGNLRAEQLVGTAPQRAATGCSPPALCRGVKVEALGGRTRTQNFGWKASLGTLLGGAAEERRARGERTAFLTCRPSGRDLPGGLVQQADVGGRHLRDQGTG